jgi:hypothetical protein
MVVVLVEVGVSKAVDVIGAVREVVTAERDVPLLIEPVVMRTEIMVASAVKIAMTVVSIMIPIPIMAPVVLIRTAAVRDAVVVVDPREVLWFWPARLNQDDRAFPDYSRAIEVSPGYALSWNGRGVIYLHRKDYENAKADFTRAIQLDPTLYQAYKNRSAAKKALGDTAGALADMTQANSLKK